jgi:hypothetical protein
VVRQSVSFSYYGHKVAELVSVIPSQKQEQDVPRGLVCIYGRFVGVGDGLGLSSLSLGLCSYLSPAAGPPVLMAMVSSWWT